MTSRKWRLVLGALLAVTWVFAGNSDRLNPAKIDFCRIVYGCGLQQPPGFCPDPKLLGKVDFVYDSARCMEARTLQARGVGPGHPIVGFQLYRFLGMEYRVIYEVSDSLPVSRLRLEYMLNDLPLAAKLVSHYRNEPYTAEYLDGAHTHFQGTKGKHLRGEAHMISGSFAEQRLFYFGTGTADIAWWTLNGPALMDFTYWPLAGKTPYVGYKMRLLVFPGNGIINTIMNLGLFRKVVLGKVREVLKDITETTRLLAESGGKDLLRNSKWTAEEQTKISAFLKIP